MHRERRKGVTGPTATQQPSRGCYREFILLVCTLGPFTSILVNCGPGANKYTGEIDVEDADCTVLGRWENDGFPGNVAVLPTTSVGDSESGTGLLFGAPSEASEDSWEPDVGAIFIFESIKPGRVTLQHADLIIRGQHRSMQFGTSVAQNWRVDGGEASMLAVSAMHAEATDDSAGVFVFKEPTSGAITSGQRDYLITSDSSSGPEPFSMCVWDRNDIATMSSLVVGSSMADGEDNNTGAVFVLSEPTDGLITEVSTAVYHGTRSSIGAGFSVSCSGDLDQDGEDDLVIGAPWADGTQFASGVVYVFTQPRDGVNDVADADAKLFGRATYSQSGYAVSGGGDANADGIDDLLVGAPGVTVEDVSGGAVFLVAGPIEGEIELSDSYAVFYGGDFVGGTGGSVSFAGDTNSDGKDEILVGAPFSWVSGVVETGAAFLVYDPQPGTHSISDVASLFYGAEGTLVGTCLANAGDQNSDGYDDFVICAPGHNNNTGIAALFFGGE